MDVGCTHCGGWEDFCCEEAGGRCMCGELNISCAGYCWWSLGPLNRDMYPQTVEGAKMFLVDRKRYREEYPRVGDDDY